MKRDQEQQAPQVVHVIPKGENHEIRISLSRYRGRRLVDIRLFIVDWQGEWIPTRKGCTIGVGQLGELEQAVMKLRAAAEQSALLEEIREWRPPA